MSNGLKNWKGNYNYENNASKNSVIHSKLKLWLFFLLIEVGYGLIEYFPRAVYYFKQGNEKGIIYVNCKAIEHSCVMCI